MWHGTRGMQYKHNFLKIQTDIIRTWEIGEEDPADFSAEPLPSFFHFVDNYDYKNRGLKASDITGTLEWLICWTNVRDNAA